MALENQYSAGSVDGVPVTADTIQKPSNDARQGVTTGRVRYILAISFVAAIAALAVVLINAPL